MRRLSCCAMRLWSVVSLMVRALLTWYTTLFSLCSGVNQVCLRVLLDQKCTVMFMHRENSELPHKERQCHSVSSWFLSISDLIHLITNSGNVHELKQTFKGKMSEIRPKRMTDIEQNHL